MLENARKQGLEVCLLMIDLDQFKQINDVHGHTAGDAVLAATISAARALLSSETSMPGGILGRLGGEEFALLIPTSAKKASALAERLRGAIGATETRYMDITIRISASFGLVSSAQSGYALRQLLINGDQALYRAKRAGRNQVALWAKALRLFSQPGSLKAIGKQQIHRFVVHDGDDDDARRTQRCAAVGFKSIAR